MTEVQRPRPVRTAFVLNSVPYPPVGGGPLRSQRNIEAARALGPVRLICFREPRLPLTADAPDFVKVPRRLLSQRGTDPGSLALGLLGLLSAKSARAALRRKRASKDRRRRAACTPWVRQALEDFAPDVVVVAESQWAPLLPDVKRLGARLVYDAHNVEADLALQADEDMEGPRSPDARIRLEAFHRSEAGLVEAADEIWTCSEEDRSLMKRLHGTSTEVRIVPNAIDVAHFRYAPERDGAGGGRILFTGSFGYPPNVEASRFLLRQVAPLVWKTKPDVAVELCGIGAGPELLELARQEPRLRVTGLVEDTRPFFEAADVLAVPLKQGGGTRLKILEAMAMGTPVVSTTKGAEGLGLCDGEHLLIADDAPGFADRVLRILEDGALASRLRASARDLVEKRFSWEATAPIVRDAIQRLATT